MKSLRFVCSLAVCAFATFLILLAAAQSNPIAHANQPNAIANAQNSPPAAQPAAAMSDLLVKFGKTAIYGSGANLPESIAIADLNGDGYPDLVVAGSGVSVLLGNGNGSFKAAVTYGTGGSSASSVAIADVNGDGKPDLVVADGCPESGCGVNSVVAVLLGNGDGTFQPAVSYSTAGYFASSVAVADVNGDGKPDLIVANECRVYSGCNQGSGRNIPGEVSVLLGNGDGTFQSPVSYNSGGITATAVAVADLNHDGYPDLVVANCTINGYLCPGGVPGEVSVLLGNGDGTFKAPVSYASGGDWATSVAIGDVNGDGYPDIVVVDSCPGSGCGGDFTARVGVLLGNGDGTFQSAGVYDSGGAYAVSVAISDLNGDGHPDLVVANSWAKNPPGKARKGELSVLPGNGDGTFQAPIRYISGQPDTEAVAVADLNGDGRPDIAVVNSADFSVGVMLNEFLATTTIGVASSPSPSQVNQPVTLTATLTASSSVPNGSPVTFSRGKANLGTTTTTNGVATFTTSFSEARTYAVEASYPGDAFHRPASRTVKQVVESDPASTSIAGASPLDVGPAGPCRTGTTLLTSGSPSLTTLDITFTSTSYQAPTCRGQQNYGCNGVVNFYDEHNQIGSVYLNVSCTATLDTTSLTAGSHNISATFYPERPWNPSSARIVQVVDKWPTTTSVTSAPNPSSYAAAVTLTASVVSYWTGPNPTGKIRLLNGTALLGTAVVNPSTGVATLTRKDLPVGTDSITAEYLGDANHLTSTGTATQTVNPATTTTAIASSHNPSMSGENVTFKATVTSSTNLRSSGTVTFTAGSATLGTVPLTGDHADISTNSLPQGTTTITATYNGSADFAGSSAALTQTVNP